jgi:hypothetical protein
VKIKNIVVFIAANVAIACDTNERTVVGDWQFIFNWSKNPENETKVKVRFVSDIFYTEDKDTGTWSQRNDSLFLMFQNKYKTKYLGRFTSDTTLTGIMFSFYKINPFDAMETKHPGIWRANKITLNQ